jgi:hypothetical protein
MNRTEIILLIMFIIIQAEILWNRYKPVYKSVKKHRKDEVLKSLIAKQKEDALVIEKDQDITMIDNYMEYIKVFIENYNSSRSKRIALKSRQELLIKTVDILPIVARHIDLNYYYNLDDKEWYKLTDRDMIMLLETAYNDYTHENLDSLNSIITAALRLRDDKR